MKNQLIHDITLTIAALAWLVVMLFWSLVQTENTAADEACPLEVVPRYVIYYELYSELSTDRVDKLPYTITGEMYTDGQWQLPADFDRSYTNRHSVIIDLRTGEMHHIRINQGRWFVTRWLSYEPGEDGHPHPIGAYWIDFEYPG